jgi:hypothetical protein
MPGLQLRIFTLPEPAQRKPKSPPWLTERLYDASRKKLDPFGETAFPAGHEPVPATSIEPIGSAGCGVLIWLASYKDPRLIPCNLAEHGVFTVALGRCRQEIPFWDEVSVGDLTSTATIFWHHSSFTHGRQVMQAETSTYLGLYFTLNAREPLVATIRMLAGLCLQMRQDASLCEQKLRKSPEQYTPDPSSLDYSSTLEAGRFIAQKLGRSAYLRWKTLGLEGRWFVAIRRNSGQSICDSKEIKLCGFQEVPLPKGTQAMADPFLYEFNGRTCLLFEDIPKGKSRGRLGCLEVLERDAYSEMIIILEKDYHLSYPCIVPCNGELFLLPESCEANRVDLFHFSRFPSELELVSTPIEHLKVVDTTPVFLNDRWYFFTTTTKPFMESLLFYSDRLDGRWTLHPSSPISCSVRNSRSAGNLVWRNGRLFRPTQDCSVRYGYAITVNEVTRLTPTEFEEHPVGRVPPCWSHRILGTHTWNESSQFQVIDGYRPVAR